MFKVQILISLIAVLCITVAIAENCLFQDEMWAADSNPKEFKYCNKKTNLSAIGSCPDGTGFVKNQTASGCIPWNDWNDACVTKTNSGDFACDKDNFELLHPAVDPEYYFLCVDQNGPAVLLKCPNGKAFSSKNNYLGCFGWDMWKSITGCNY